MPRIILKPQSPEYADAQKQPELHLCDMPGCAIEADHKAPKHRGLNEYYHFCFDHVREYNKAWDFFSGMSEKEVQDHMTSSIYGDRPTWKYGVNGKSAEEELLKAAQKAHGGAYQKQNSDKKRQEDSFELQGNTPEHQALATMGLEAPITLETIKRRYKLLAKKYHPDLNRNDPDAEELLKKVNMAYTILKMAYEDYKSLPEQNV